MKSKKEFDPSDFVPAVVSKNVIKYFPYVAEIRKRFMLTLALFTVFFLAGFFFYQNIVSFVLRLFSLEGVNIVFTTPFQFFSLALNCGLVVGVVAIIPMIVYQTLSFLKPALQPREYRLLGSILPLSLFLFALGFAYGVMMMKYLLQIFYQSSVKLQIGNVLDVESLLSNIIITGLLMGVAFLFPIVMTILMQLHIVSHQAFVQQRRLAYMIGIIFIMFLPPPDLISDVILFSPLLILFELTLIFNRIFLRR